MNGPRAAAGVRDLARDVQRFGLLSASSVVDRYLDLVDRAVGRAATPAVPSTDRPTDPFADGDPRALAESAARITEAYLGLVEAAATIAGPAAAGEALLVSLRAGDVAEAPLWVHNPGPEPTEALTVTAGSLVAAHGASLDSASVGCVPSVVDGIAPRGSARVDVRVQVPPDQPPGLYHGVVVSSLAPGDPIRVTVEVLAS